MSAVVPIDRCRVCASPSLDPLRGLGELPAYIGRHSQKPQARVQDLVRRVICTACGTLQTDGSLLPMHLYPDANDFDHSTPKSRVALKRLANRLISDFPLASSDLVIDVGSNDGTLLKSFMAHGSRTIGIEPAAILTARAHHDGVPTLHGQFGPVISRYLLRRVGRARLIVSRFLLGVLPDVSSFLQSIASLLEPDGAAVLQVRDSLAVHRGLGGEMVHAMTPCALTLRGLLPLLAQCRLTLTDTVEGPVNSGSRFLTLRPDGSHGEDRGLWQRHLESERALGWAEFAARWQRSCTALHREVIRMVRSGLRVVGFSASADAVALLHLARLGPDLLAEILDPNLLAHGMWTSVGPVPITAADRAGRADVLVLLDRSHQAAAQEWARSRPPTRLLIPFPQPHEIPSNRGTSEAA